MVDVLGEIAAAHIENQNAPEDNAADLVKQAQAAQNIPSLPGPVAEGETAQPPVFVPPPPAEKKGPGRPKGKKDSRPRQGARAGQFATVPEVAPAAPPAAQLFENGAAQATAPGTAPPAPLDPDAAAAAAKMYVTMGLGAAQAVFGEEWKPEPEEEKQLVEATTQYIIATGALTLSPGWALLFAVGVYSVPRCSKPNTLEKIKGWIVSARQKILGR